MSNPNKPKLPSERILGRFRAVSKPAEDWSVYYIAKVVESLLVYLDEQHAAGQEEPKPVDGPDTRVCHHHRWTAACYECKREAERAAAPIAEPPSPVAGEPTLGEALERARRMTNAATEVDLEELERFARECLAVIGDHGSFMRTLSVFQLEARPEVVLALIAELRTLREAHERTRKALIDYHECEGFEHTTFIDEDGDEVSCPEDDTCDCPWFDAINEAMKPLPALPDAPKGEL